MAMAEPLLLTVVRMRLEVRIHGIHCDGQALIAAVAVECQGGDNLWTQRASSTGCGAQAFPLANQASQNVGANATKASFMSRISAWACCSSFSTQV